MSQTSEKVCDFVNKCVHTCTPVLGEHSVTNSLCYFMEKIWLRLEVKWKNEESGWLLAHLEFPKASQI